MNLPRVVLLPRRARPFYGRHPWVYAGAIAHIEGDPADGAEVDLYSHGGHFVARGLFNHQSKIQMRLYSWSPTESLDRAFFGRLLDAALHLRGPILGLNEPGKACRLVSSEGDGFSGLTVDRYDRWLVVQITALGLAQRLDLLLDLLEERLHPEGIYLRTERGIGQLEGLAQEDRLVRGQVPAEAIVVEDGGLRFQVHLTEGQKTGFYLDQRDNRQAVARLSRGRTVLDAFCYSGGFGLHAAKAGAKSVLGIDASEPALALARANAALNQLDQVAFVKGDVFDQLARLVTEEQRFGVVVLDPPKFARRKNAVEEALRGYRRLQSLGIQLLEPDGVLVTCCCSGLITQAMLEELMAQLAVEERRDIQILERRGQAPDHPVAATCPEGNYLKCLICRVR